MKLKFKQQAYQTDVVRSVVDRFAGQPKSRGFKYAVDPGRAGLSSTLPLAASRVTASPTTGLPCRPASCWRTCKGCSAGRTSPFRQS